MRDPPDVDCEGARQPVVLEAGILSHEFLRHYGWTIDFDRTRMVFTR